MSYDYRFASGKKPLYGHTTPDTAYVIDDYPHGFRDRCKKRVWLEFKAKQGWRLVYQTSQQWYPGSGESAPPDNQLRWAKPKASTYYPVAGCMYLDSQDHVQWEALHAGAKMTDCMSFMADFPEADFSGIKSLAFYNIRYNHAILRGALVATNGGDARKWSDVELQDARKKLGEWLEVGKAAKLQMKPEFAQECQDLVDGKAPATEVDPEAWKANKQQKEEAAAADKKQKSETTKGAMTLQEFVELLTKKIDPKDRELDFRTYDDSVTVTLYNGRKGQNKSGENRFAWSVGGFERNPEMKAVKVKLEEEANAAGNWAGEAGRDSYQERMKMRKEWTLRGKSGTPQQVAEYLTKHVHKVIAELVPGEQKKTATYDRSFSGGW